MIATAFLEVLMLFAAADVLAVTSNDVNKLMRNAQDLYFKGKAQEADDALKKAEEMAAEIMAGPNAAEKEKVKRLDSGLNKLRKDIDLKLGKSAGKAAPPRLARALLRPSQLAPQRARVCCLPM